MLSGWLSLREASDQTGIPVRTLRRYVERHPDYLLTRKDGRNYFLAVESLPAAQSIRRSYALGATLDQVEQNLAEQFPRTLTIPTGDNDTIVTPVQAIARLADELTELREELVSSAREQASALEYLHEEAERRDVELREWLNKRLPRRDARRLSLLVRVKKMLLRDG